jgi:hypothetical protein
MRHLSKTLLFAVWLCAAPMALAERFAADDNPRFLVAQQDGPTLSEAVEQVRRQYKGRIVSAETTVSGKREIHLIKVLTEDGKVKTIRIPGRSRGA